MQNNNIGGMVHTVPPVKQNREVINENTKMLYG